jgi:FMN phosphatase YigB (HAD superfamily)
VIFDYGFTMSSEYYFNVPHPGIHGWSELIQASVFADTRVARAWMYGEIGIGDIARIIQDATGEEHASILHYLRIGCRHLRENAAVAAFARRLKASGVPIGLVTVNFDIFNEVIVPEHGYDKLFDVIVNSCDYAEIDKRVLWPIAFSHLGAHIGYANSLLIEDGPENPQRFRDLGGYAIEYTDDAAFRREIAGFDIVNTGLELTRAGRAADA